MNNKGLCNKCKILVPARREQRGNKIYLVKECPGCGTTETLISRDAERYGKKRNLDAMPETGKCGLDCLACHHNSPNILFLDITNRCNLNCPICINNTPSMGFLFEPPLEYFRKIFGHFARQEPKPSIQLFGGEPTVREDLFDIIRIARKCGLALRLTTNGIRFADEEYCRKIINTRTTVLFAYDGDNEELYKHFRGNGNILARKKKGLDNIEKIGKAKVVIMSLVARGWNDHSLPELFQFCHERRNTVRGLYLMPLAETFNTENVRLDVERTTTEDIENIVNDSFPHDSVDFVPAGFLGQTPNILQCLNIKPLPFLGAHPNCESLYLLLSNGTGYVPIGRYLKGSSGDLCKDMLRAERVLARKVQGYDTSLMGRIFSGSAAKKRLLFLYAFFLMAGVLKKNFHAGKLLKGRGAGKLWHLALLLSGLLSGRPLKQAFSLHTNVGSILQIVILPFEDNSNLETERVSRCPAGFAFWDPEDDRVKSVPVCAWGLYKNQMMHKISDFYASQQTPAQS